MWCDQNFLLERSSFPEGLWVRQTRLGGKDYERNETCPKWKWNGKCRLWLSGEKSRSNYLGDGINGPGDAVWEGRLTEAGVENRSWVKL